MDGRRNSDGGWWKGAAWLAAAVFMTLAAGCAPIPTDLPLPEAAAAGRSGIQVIPVNEAQAPAYVDDEALELATPENARVQISLGAQRAQFFAGERVAIDTPIATGTASNPTPAGSFTILERKTSHRSSLYGDYVDSEGSVVRRGVDRLKVPEPPGATWRGTLMPYWQRMSWDGVGMHVGPLPGRPASHGCVRFPAAVMPLIYEKTRIGTPVVVVVE